MSAAAKILDRLQRVRQTGPGRWLACCPAHEDRSPSLSIREINDRVLLYDFGGCETDDILAALGLELRDLFDQPIGHQAPITHSRIPARDLLDVISEETSVIALIAADLLECRAISALDWQRLATAASRIHRARDYLHG